MLKGAGGILLPSGIALLVALGLTHQKLFSLNMGQPETKSLLQTEKSLLLLEADGVLPESDALKVIRNLDTFVSKKHIVKRSEWLEKIAQAYGVSPYALRSTNNLEDPQVRPNQEVIVQNKKGMVHISKEGETLESVIRAYERLGSKREKILAMNLLDEITFIKGDE